MKEHNRLSSRYSRQTLLREIGTEGQEILFKSRVLIIGMGGLGCPASLYLAGAGIGHLGLVDDDHVDETNLQRQILFATSETGALKVEAARKRLLALNPHISIQTYPTRFSAINAKEIFSNYDLVIDGSDNFSTKFLINDAAVKWNLPLIYGSISQFEAQVSVFWAKKGPCYRCLYPEPPVTRIQNCAESGVIGALAGIIGSSQALEAIKLLVSQGRDDHPLRPLVGRLLMIDTGSWRTSSPKIGKRPDCPVCAIAPDQIKLVDQPDFCSTLSASAEDTSKPGEAIDYETLDRLQSYTAVDVRDASEWVQGHLPGAIHLPLSQIENADSLALVKDRGYVLYCRSGMRSQKALALLAERGFKHLKHLKGGLLSLGSRASVLRTDPPQK